MEGGWKTPPPVLIGLRIKIKIIGLRIKTRQKSPVLIGLRIKMTGFKVKYQSLT